MTTRTTTWKPCLQSVRKGPEHLALPALCSAAGNPVLAPRLPAGANGLDRIARSSGPFFTRAEETAFVAKGQRCVPGSRAGPASRQTTPAKRCLESDLERLW